VNDDLKDANDDIAKKQQQLIQWDASYKSLQEQLASERAEVKRLQALDGENVKIVKVIEIKEVEVEREVIKYRDNPNVVKCTLNSNWVYLHDRATQRSDVPQTWGNVAGKVQVRPGETTYNWRLPDPVSDA